MEISSANQLRAFLTKVVDEQKSKYEGSIEEYLRSVWSSILSHRDESPTYSLFGEILQNAFGAKPAIFENVWMKHTAPPEELHTLLRSEKPLDREVDFACLRSEVLFLIAELRRMQLREEDKMKDFGVASPTGHTFYNWDPFSFLECGTAGLISSVEGGLLKGRSGGPRCNWSLLAFILELGRVYE